MKNQNHEIVPQKMNEIEPLNEIVELDLESLEAIVGGLGCGTKIGPCPSLECVTKTGATLANKGSNEFVGLDSDSYSISA